MITKSTLASLSSHFGLKDANEVADAYFELTDSSRMGEIPFSDFCETFVVSQLYKFVRSVQVCDPIAAASSSAGDSVDSETHVCVRLGGCASCSVWLTFFCFFFPIGSTQPSQSRFQEYDVTADLDVPLRTITTELVEQLGATRGAAESAAIAACFDHDNAGYVHVNDLIMWVLQREKDVREQRMRQYKRALAS